MLTIRCKSWFQLRVFYHFQYLHLYSTKSPNQTTKSPNLSYSRYLVNNLGFSQQHANSISTKIQTKNNNYTRLFTNANLVVDFLKQHGFDDTHIKLVVTRRPQILASNLDKTLIPKFKFLQDYGFSASNLVSLISADSSLLAKSLESIIPDLKAILGSNDNIIKFFRNIRSFRGTHGLENLYSNMALLNNKYGIDIQVIRNAILQRPEYYMKDTQCFRNILIKVEKELKIPRNCGMFLYGVSLLCISSMEMIDSKSQLLKSFGWTESDVFELMRRTPQAFLLSEENIRKKLGFLMTDLGYKPDYLATRATLFLLSLEKRLAPRQRVLLVLKEKGLLLDYNFYTAAMKSEKHFLKILIQPFKKDAPGLLELYQSNKG